MSLSLRHIITIAKRELSGYFSSPVAYVFIVIFLLLTGFFTFMISSFLEQRQANLAPFFVWHPWLYLFLVPAAAMRLWSEERRQGTLELLLTMPITAWQAIVGKFLASWAFLAIALALTFPIVWTANYLGSPDNGVIFCGYVGSLLLAGGYLAIGCMTSALTRNQVVSFILSVVICFVLIMVGWPPVTNFLLIVVDWLPVVKNLLAGPAGVKFISLVSSFSVMPHFESMQRGVIDSRDLLFFLSLIGFPLFTTAVILRSIRS